MNPLLSVVTPVKNGAPWILKCIDSVSRLDIPYEHIIVYAKSTDNTFQLLKSAPYPLTILHEPSNSSTIYHAIDHGFQHSSGRILSYLNCDNFILSDNFSRAVHFLTTQRVDLLIGGYRLLHEEPGLHPKTFLPSLFPRYFLIHGLMPSAQPSFIFSRRCFEAFGLQTTYRFAGDLHFFRNVALDCSYRICAIPDVLSCFLFRSSSLGNANSLSSVKETIHITGKRPSYLLRLYFLASRYFAFLRFFAW